MKTRWLLRSRWALALALLVDLLTYGGRYRQTHVSQASLSAALAAQAQVTDAWLAKEGVVGTAIGMDAHGDAVLKVYLTAPGAAMLPATVAGVDVSLEVVLFASECRRFPAVHPDPRYDLSV